MEHITGKDDPRIRARAHALWERDGRPQGRHIDHWQQATREIAEEDAALGPDAGIQVPDNASERTLREAAELLRGVDAHPHGHSRGRASANDPAEETATGWAGTRG